VGYDCAPASHDPLPIILGVAGVLLVGILIAVFACRKKEKGRMDRPLLS